MKWSSAASGALSMSEACRLLVWRAASGKLYAAPLGGGRQPSRIVMWIVLLSLVDGAVYAASRFEALEDGEGSCEQSGRWTAWRRQWRFPLRST